MEMTSRRGRGYEPAISNKIVGEAIGTIPVDSLFSPIRKVNYQVTNARVGQVTDYDRLLLEIWTDGTMQPDDAVSQAARILTQYATAVAGYGRNMADLGIEEAAAQAEDDTDRSIEVLSLSMRTTNALKRANITTIAQVLSLTDNDLLHLRNFGQKSLVELREALVAHGYAAPGDYEVDEAQEADEEEPAEEE